MANSNGNSNGNVNGNSDKNQNINPMQWQFNPYGYMMNPMMQMQMYNPMMQPMQNPMMQIQNPMMQPPMMQPPMMQPMMQPPMMQPMMQPPMMQPMMQQPMMQQPMMQQPMMQPMMHPMMQMLQQQQHLIPLNNGINFDIRNNINDIENVVGDIIDVNLSKKKILKRKIISEDEILEDNIEDKSINKLSNLFDDVLDNERINKKSKKDNAFLSDKKNKNVVIKIKPYNLNTAHFNNESHPNEIYTVDFLDGNTSEISSKDINKDTLKTQKLNYEHNIKIANAYPNIPPNATNTVIYVRRSIKDKEHIDNSIKTQTDACYKFAFENNMKMAPFGYLEDNGVSGRNGKNLISGELAFWLSHIPNHSNIIVYSPDRWCRNTLKGLEVLDSLSKRDITVHFVTNNIKYNKDITSANRAMIQTELMTAEKQSNDTSEKIKGTLKRLKAEGNIIGRAPYGFSNVIIDGIRKRVSNDSEKKMINKIKNKYNDIIENFENYKNNEYLGRSESSIIKFIMRWSSREGMKNRNNVAFTISQIGNIVNSD